MRTLLFASVILVGNHFLQAQTFSIEWAKIIGSNEYNTPYINSSKSLAYDNTTDSYGNYFTTGLFQDTLDFDPGEGRFDLNSNGDPTTNAFITKLDSVGNFLWAKSLLSNKLAAGYCMITDNSDNIYVAGTFQDSLIFEINNLKHSLVSKGPVDVFLTKLNSAGEIQWLKQLDSKTEVENKFWLETDSDDHVYFAFNFTDTLHYDLNNPGSKLYSEGYHDIFCSKLDSEGNFQWIKQTGASGTDKLYSLKLQDDTKLHCLGIFERTVDFDPNTGIANLNAESSNGFVQVLASDGNLVQARFIADQTFEKDARFEIDEENNIYYLYQVAPGMGLSYMTVQKIDETGDIQWNNEYGDFSGTNLPVSTCTDLQGNLYVWGRYFQYPDFDPSYNEYTSPIAGYHGSRFLSRINKNGSLAWVSFMEVGYVFGISLKSNGKINCDDQGNVYMSGWMEGEYPIFDIGSENQVNLNTSNLVEISSTSHHFKMSQDGWENTNWDQVIPERPAYIVYPNPAYTEVNIEFDDFPINSSLALIDQLGRYLFQADLLSYNKKITIPLSNYRNGMYYIAFERNGKTTLEKLIIE
jgi:hypothetical protein